MKQRDEYIVESKIHSPRPDEQSTSLTTGELHYIHPRIRAAYRSLRTNLPYLFTYKNYKHLSI